MFIKGSVKFRLGTPILTYLHAPHIPTYRVVQKNFGLVS